jgi:hypothetical protein
MRQLALAAQTANVTHKKFPPLIGAYPSGKMGVPTSVGQNGPPWGNTLFHLLPFIEQDNLRNLSNETNINNTAGTFFDPLFLTDLGYQPWFPWPPASVIPPPGAGYPPPTGTLPQLMQNNAVRTFLCPGDPSAPTDGVGIMGLGATPVTPMPAFYPDVSLTSYAANALVFGTPAPGDPLCQLPLATSDGKTRITDISDGASNTIFFTERYANVGLYNDDPVLGLPGGNAWAWWGAYISGRPVFNSTVFADSSVPAFNIWPYVFNSAAPQIRPVNYKTNTSNWRPSSPHTGVIIVGLGDGSARSVSEGISWSTWWAACTPAGGEIQAADW